MPSSSHMLFKEHNMQVAYTKVDQIKTKTNIESQTTNSFLRLTHLEQSSQDNLHKAIINQAQNTREGSQQQTKEPKKPENASTASVMIDGNKNVKIIK